MATLRQWIRNARPVSLPQSLMPALLALILAAGAENSNSIMGLLAVAGVVFAHFAMNLADDYFDYRVDMLGSRDRIIRQGFRAMTRKYPYLTDGTETPRSLARAIIGMLAFAVLCGGAIFVYRTITDGFTGPQGSWQILLIAGITGVLGIFYSAPPLKLGYRGLGEPVIGIIFGPLLMAGVAYSAAGCVNAEVLLISIPVGLLVMNILYTHSFIDLPGDEASNKMTLARLLPGNGARLACVYVCNLLPYLIIIAAVCAGRIHPVYLAVLLVVPRSLWLCRSLKRFAGGDTAASLYPPLIIGRIPDWKRYREQGTDWFMLRWLTSRNILMAFCAVIFIARMALVIYQAFV